MPCYFYPRSPCGERRTRPPAGGMKPRISIHALLAESDPAHQVQVVAVQNFYPRSPCGERRQDTGKWPWPSQFLSTLSLRRATNDAINGCNPDFISIHALLAESDGTSVCMCTILRIFLSTLSLRRATWKKSPPMCSTPHFYPRSPCGERLVIVSMTCLLRDFYPRSPCGERPSCFGRLKVVHYFYPRSPCGERRLLPARRGCGPGISIHALLAESDITEMRLALDDIKFLSTLSLRRATHGPGSYARVCGISIHALLAESDISTEAMTHDI